MTGVLKKREKSGHRNGGKMVLTGRQQQRLELYFYKPRKAKEFWHSREYNE